MAWQKQLRSALTKPEQLIARLGLGEHTLLSSNNTLDAFPLLATEPFVSRIQPGNDADPLLKQIFPAIEEDVKSNEYIDDPVGDLDSQARPGLLQKYHGRVLLIVTGACPIHCRYCFRRHYPYAENSINPKQLDEALRYINNDKEITEVILSGGDPLILNDKKLSELVEQLHTIPHLKRIRFHTRTPIVLPDRILESDLSWLTQSKLKTIMVLHCNHPNELDEKVKTAINKLAEHNMLLLNQSVLLRGVNDRAEILIQLSEKLFEFNIQPYYLHMLDPVSGAKHFNVPQEQAITIMDEVRTKLPGYLVPNLVRECKGGLSKLPV